jgi:hypothetical protein
MASGNRFIVCGTSTSASAVGNSSCWAFGTKNTIILDSAQNKITVNGSQPSPLNFDFSNGAVFDDNGSGVYNPYLFGANLIGNFSTAANTTMIYGYKVEKAGNVIINLIPAVNPSDEVGMYDTVSRSFFGNQKSGSAFTGA